MNARVTQLRLAFTNIEAHYVYSGCKALSLGFVKRSKASILQTIFQMDILPHMTDLVVE